MFDFIEHETLDAKRRFANEESAVEQINVAAGYAFALHHDLTTAGKSLAFSETLLENRGVPPTDPEFFRHLHALEDFVAAVRRLG
ncbi:hypothetical protein R5W24_006523 [Gemmata sp. JC717]|uniref:hypothetical protein n=1 Tax=Gemmata algarum TaxID=2975278 RepID=UPI0021BB1811|nr:hypothetical protein [Gemmata algarum]MDY3557335.1 hypothetical protein [Gemmata algarum]